MKNLTFISVLFICTIFTTPAYSLAKPIGFATTVKTTINGVRAAVKYSANGRVYTKVLELSKASLGAVIRKRAFSPWGAAIAVAVVAAGYALNDNDVDIGTSSVQPLVTWRTNTGSYQSYNTCIGGGCTHQEALDMMILICDNFNNPCTLSHIDVIDPLQEHIYVFKSGGTASSKFGTALHGTDTGQTETVTTTLSDTDLATAVMPVLSESLTRQMLVDPDTTFPDELITELQQAATALDTEVALLNDGDPANDPQVVTPSVTYAENQLQTNTTNNNQTTVEADAEADDFTYDFTGLNFDPSIASVDKMDPLEAMNDAQEDILAFTDTVGVTATNGQCSFNVPISLGGYSKTGSVDFCYFKSSFNDIGAVILSIAYLFSGLIVLGVKA